MRRVVPVDALSQTGLRAIEITSFVNPKWIPQLADGGEVLMPLQATPWSPRYGVVRDPFGIRWEINCDAEPAA